MHIDLDLGETYKRARAEMSEEEQTQRKREASIFQSIYMNPNLIPQNPIKELDELYVKDDKILISDCGEIAADYFKQKDDENFEKELLILTQELQQLDEGKYRRHTHRHAHSIDKSQNAKTQVDSEECWKAIASVSKVHFVTLALLPSLENKFPQVLMMTLTFLLVLNPSPIISNMPSLKLRLISV